MRNRSSSRLPIPALAILLASLTALSQSNQQQVQPPIDGELRLLTVTVKNEAGNYVMGVPREAFELMDEKERRSVEFFENTDGPASIGILIDTSRSMEAFENSGVAPLAPIGEVIARFLGLANAGNEYFLMAFDKTPRLVADWTSGQTLLAKKTIITQEKIATALYDACFAAVEKLQTAHYSKRVVILISDGQDTISRHTFKELRDLLRRSDVTLYGIGLRGPSIAGSSLGMEGDGIMEELAEVTGGEALFSEDKKRLSQVIELLAIQLRHQYRIGFRTVKTDPPNKWHRLKLKVNPSVNAPKEFTKLTARTRQGYYTP